MKARTPQSRASTRSTHLTRLPNAPQSGRVPLTVAEVFGWICAKQGIAHPEKLNDARYHCLYSVADKTYDRIADLFGGEI